MVIGDTDRLEERAKIKYRIEEEKKKQQNHDNVSSGVKIKME